MKRLLVILLLLCPLLTYSLNLPPITTANLARIEAGLQYAKTNRITWVRMNTAMAEAAKGTTLDTYAHTRAGQLVAQYGRKVVLVDQTQAGNNKYWRLQSGLDDAQLWNDWKNDEANGFYQNGNNPNGLYPWLLPLAVDASNRLVEAFEVGLGRKVDIRQIENEPGETVNSNLHPPLKYGYVSAGILKTIEEGSEKSGVLASPAWETETMAGLMEQIRAEDKGFWGKFSYQGINWYLTKWLPLDTVASWAARCVAELKAFINDVWWPGRRILISELAAIGASKELRLLCFKEFRRICPSMWIPIWHDYDSVEWGVQ